MRTLERVYPKLLPSQHPRGERDGNRREGPVTLTWRLALEFSDVGGEEFLIS